MRCKPFGARHPVKSASRRLRARGAHEAHTRRHGRQRVATSGNPLSARGADEAQAAPWRNLEILTWRTWRP
eukprot:6272895-Pyramimonas_sp.AAC.1